MDSIVTIATAVDQRSTVKVIQSVLKSTENRHETANLGGVTCEVKGLKSAQSTVKSLKVLTRSRSCDYRLYGSGPSREKIKLPN